MNRQSRRDFLKLLGKVSAAAPLCVNLSAINNVAAATASDYKALICIYLQGGNDQANTIIPIDTSNYNSYLSIRPSVAFPKDQLLVSKINPLNSLPSNALELALNPAMVKMKELFEERKLALLFNVGNLEQPTSLTQYMNGTAKLPPKLFSHNDQQSIWLSSGAEGSVNGWGGALGDLALDINQKSNFTNISVRGNSVFLSGNNTSPYQVSVDGAIPIYGAQENSYYQSSFQANKVVRELLMQHGNNPYENTYKDILTRSIDSEKYINAALDNIPIFQQNALENIFPERNHLAKQLKIVAKLIAAQSDLGTIKRQVFMVELRGFDCHDKLLTKHTMLLEELSEAMFAFQRATEHLGISNQVTSFTASEFGRSFTSNGDGSDHGWGGHQFIMGGAVNGGRTYGEIPEFALKTDTDVGNGRLLPTTPTSSYIATLANWFGISENDLPYVVPTVNNFDNSLLGFV